EPADRGRLAGLPRSGARRAVHPPRPVRQRRRGRARHDGGPGRPARLDRPGRLVGADQGPARLLRAAAPGRGGAAGGRRDGLPARGAADVPAGGHRLPPAAGAALGRPDGVPGRAAGRRPAHRRPLAHAPAAADRPLPVPVRARRPLLPPRRAGARRPAAAARGPALRRGHRRARAGRRRRPRLGCPGGRADGRPVLGGRPAPPAGHGQPGRHPLGLGLPRRGRSGGRGGRASTFARSRYDRPV
ncbi:MAG: FIG00821119: hypothetical protein, partial [uncultured Corynebacteriales bacterium]